MLLYMERCSLNGFGRTDLCGGKRAPPSFHIQKNIHSGARRLGDEVVLNV